MHFVEKVVFQGPQDHPLLLRDPTGHSCDWLQSKRLQSKTSRGPKSRGNQAPVSRILYLWSHRMCLVPPAMSCNKMKEILSTRESFGDSGSGIFMGTVHAQASSAYCRPFPKGKPVFGINHIVPQQCGYSEPLLSLGQQKLSPNPSSWCRKGQAFQQACTVHCFLHGAPQPLHLCSLPLSSETICLFSSGQNPTPSFHSALSRLFPPHQLFQHAFPWDHL